RGHRALVVGRCEPFVALCVRQLEAKRRCVVEARGEPAFTSVIDHRPVLLVPIGVADQRIEDEIAREPVPRLAGCLPWGRANTVKDLCDHLDRVIMTITRIAYDPGEPG